MDSTMISSKTVAGTAFCEFDVFVCVLHFSILFCSVFFGLRLVDTFDRVTGDMDKQNSRNRGHSEHYYVRCICI